jgi:hypothetical protein
VALDAQRMTCQNRNTSSAACHSRITVNFWQGICHIASISGYILTPSDTDGAGRDTKQVTPQ